MMEVSLLVVVGHDGEMEPAEAGAVYLWMQPLVSWHACKLIEGSGSNRMLGAKGRDLIQQKKRCFCCCTMPLALVGRENSREGNSARVLRPVNMQLDSLAWACSSSCSLHAGSVEVQIVKALRVTERKSPFVFRGQDSQLVLTAVTSVSLRKTIFLMVNIQSLAWM